jgi:hypothetical protein
VTHHRDIFSFQQFYRVPWTRYHWKACVSTVNIQQRFWPNLHILHMKNRTPFMPLLCFVYFAFPTAAFALISYKNLMDNIYSWSFLHAGLGRAGQPPWFSICNKGFIWHHYFLLSGFIPKSQHYFGKRYADNCLNSIADFEQDQIKHREIRIIGPKGGEGGLCVSELQWDFSKCPWDFSKCQWTFSKTLGF